ETARPLNEDALPDQLAVSVITIGELRAGVLAATDVATRDRRPVTLTSALALEPTPLDGAVADAWAPLRIALRGPCQRMPINDSWIAATALAYNVAVVTQDDDYVDIPGFAPIEV